MGDGTRGGEEGKRKKEKLPTVTSVFHSESEPAKPRSLYLIIPLLSSHHVFRLASPPKNPFLVRYVH